MTTKAKPETSVPVELEEHLQEVDATVAPQAGDLFLGDFLQGGEFTLAMAKKPTEPDSGLQLTAGKRRDIAQVGEVAGLDTTKTFELK